METHSWVQCCMCSAAELAHCRHQQHVKHRGTVMMRHEATLLVVNTGSICPGLIIGQLQTHDDCSSMVLYHLKPVWLPSQAIYNACNLCGSSASKTHCVGLVCSNKQLLQNLGCHPFTEAVNPSLHECRVPSRCVRQKL